MALDSQVYVDALDVSPCWLVNCFIDQVHIGTFEDTDKMLRVCFAGVSKQISR